MRANVLCALIFILSIGSWAAADKSVPYFSSDDLTPYWQNEKVSTQPASVGEFHAIDQKKNPITEKNFDHRISLVNFFFATCSGMCPIMMSSIQDFQKQYATSLRGVRVYSFSVQPQKDSPEVLQSYAKLHHMDLQKFTLITGDQSQIFHVGKDMFKADGSIGKMKSPNSFIHTRNIYLLDGKRKIRGIYDTSNAEALSRLAEDITALKCAQGKAPDAF